MPRYATCTSKICGSLGKLTNPANNRVYDTKGATFMARFRDPISQLEELRTPLWECRQIQAQGRRRKRYSHSEMPGCWDTVTFTPCSAANDQLSPDVFGREAKTSEMSYLVSCQTFTLKAKRLLAETDRSCRSQSKNAGTHESFASFPCCFTA